MNKGARNHGADYISHALSVGVILSPPSHALNGHVRIVRNYKI